MFLVNCPRITGEKKCKFLIIPRKLVCFFLFACWYQYTHIKGSLGTCKNVDLVLFSWQKYSTLLQ